MKKQFQVIGLGEILWDLLPEGKKLGGAPANFAYHADQLGNQARVVSRIGNDRLGDEIISELHARNISTEYLQIDATHPTGTVHVRLDTEGQPQYTITENVAWDFLTLGDNLAQVLPQIDAICFGSLAQRNRVSQQTILCLLEKLPKTALRVFDINLRQQYYSVPVIEKSLVLSHVLKINDEELLEVANLLNIKENRVVPLCRKLCQRYDLKMVALTRGKNGSHFITPNDTCEHPGFPVEAVDTVGAGDAFTAAMVHHWLKGSSLVQMNTAANRLGAFVATQTGATPVLPQNILAEIA